MFVYSLKRPYKYKDKIDVYNHSVFLSESRHFLVPFQMDLNCVNPEFFHKLKIRFNIKDIQIERQQNRETGKLLGSSDNAEDHRWPGMLGDDFGTVCKGSDCEC